MTRASTEPWPRLCAWPFCTEHARNRFSALCVGHLVSLQAQWQRIRGRRR